MAGADGWGMMMSGGAGGEMLLKLGRIGEERRVRDSSGSAWNEGGGRIEAVAMVGCVVVNTRAARKHHRLRERSDSIADSRRKARVGLPSGRRDLGNWR